MLAENFISHAIVGNGGGGGRRGGQNVIFCHSLKSELDMSEGQDFFAIFCRAQQRRKEDDTKAGASFDLVQQA